MTPEKRSPSKEVKTFTRLACASIDFSAAREAAETLIANYQNWQHGDAIRAVTTGIIVAYARPFGENDGLGALPKSFRVIDDVDAQTVHDRVLDARDHMEAHNNILERGRFISSREASDDPLDIQVNVRVDGSAFWNAAVPALRLPEYHRLVYMLRIQEKRVWEAANAALKELLSEQPHHAGLYSLKAHFQ